LTRVDWDSIGELGFWATDRAARSVAGRYSAVEEDDVYQEALLYYATHPDEMEAQRQYGESLPGIRGGEFGARKAVARQLTRRMSEWAQRQGVNAGLELLAAGRKQEERPDLSRWANRPVPPGFEGLPYSPAGVEGAFPMLWEESQAGVVQVAQGPDEGMPRAATDKSHANTGYAIYADIRRAWDKAPLSLEQRQAVFLAYGLGWTQEQIGEALGFSHQTAMRRIDSAIETVATHLNGKAVSLSGSND